jgi:hypothetical protein
MIAIQPASSLAAPAANAPLDALRSAPQPFLPGLTAVPPSGKLIDAHELQLMVEAALDGWLTTGRFNAEFETRLAAFIGVKHLITVNSGSSANLVAFSTLTSPRLGERAIRPGDEVIGVAAGFPTTVNPILQFGAVPVFVDVELGTYNIDASQIEAAIGPKTKAIMLAHTLGNPFNLDAITALCKKHGLWLIEDCCDALGSTYQGRMVGTFGDIGTLSFYPAHHITMGEGGAVFTNNAELKAIAESFRDWGRDCYCAPGKDNTCGKALLPEAGPPARGLRPQVHLQPPGLQPQDHRHAGRLRAGAVGQGRPVHRAAQAANFAYLHAQPGKGVRGIPHPAPAPRNMPTRPGSAFPSPQARRRPGFAPRPADLPRPEQGGNPPAFRRKPDAPTVYGRQELSRER